MHQMRAMREEHDYIVIGAGSAGSVIAARLSEDEGASVCLLEAGPSDGHYSIRMPAAISINIKGRRYNWGYLSEPQSALGGKCISLPRGRVLGGSSSLNGMIFIRGHAYDYDGWEEDRAKGWGYRHVLPYFKRLEAFEGGASLYRGGSGPVPVRSGSLTDPLHQTFLEAGEQAGFPRTADVNGYQQYGVGTFDKNIAGGERWSASRAYLGPARRRRNLTIRTGAQATRIVLEGRRAAGVELVVEGREQVLRPKREIILCAGAFDSPKLLMLSGIGNPDDLHRFGIPLAAPLRGVGRNLQDHTEVHIQHRCREPITLYGDLKPARRLLAGAQWFLTRSGPAATNHYDTGAFLSTDGSQCHANIQYHFVPIVYNNSVERRVDCHGYRLHAGPMRPASRGKVALRSADWRDAPVIDPRYFSEERDWREMRRIVEIARHLFAQPAFGKYRDVEMSPGADIRGGKALDDFIRAWGDTGYHPAGTCRMGEGEEAVVDAECRVHGIEGLRVVDASIMPMIASGNLNAPVMMMAEKASDMILGRPPLPPEEAPVYETERRRIP